MIIAELSHNHLGDMEVLADMVAEAAKAGAWAVKIQTHFAQDLTPEWKEKTVCVNGKDIKRQDFVAQYELNFEQHKLFVKWCTDAGVIPMTSVYSTKHLQMLSDAGFKWLKVGSAESHKEKLIRAIKGMGFKCIISTGGQDVRKMPKVRPIEGVLHCVSKYPHLPQDANILRLYEIQKFWPNTPFGFSSHVTPTIANWASPGRLASFLGATYLEYHFTTRDRRETPDGKVSLHPRELKEIAQYDRLTFEEKRDLSHYGILLNKQEEEEKELIKEFSKRWRE